MFWFRVSTSLGDSRLSSAPFASSRTIVSTWSVAPLFILRSPSRASVSLLYDGQNEAQLVFRPGIGMLFPHCFFDHRFPVALNLPDFGFRRRRLRRIWFHFFRFLR